MRVFALSDIHIDYEVNKQWIAQLSEKDFRDDLLILAGDVCDSIKLLTWGLSALVRRFARVLYVPGNHELWVIRDQYPGTSLEKFHEVCRTAENCGARVRPFHSRRLSIVPLFGWYDYSFGDPAADLLESWMDYKACRWEDHFSPPKIASYFLEMNNHVLEITNQTIISFSHFVPRIDLMPGYIPESRKILYPVLGTTGLEAQIRRLKPAIHVYGHTHVNRDLKLDDVRYINNAFGYPHETVITAKQLVCVYES